MSKATEGPFLNMAKKAARMVRLLRELRKLRAHFVGSAKDIKSLMCGSFAWGHITGPCSESWDLTATVQITFKIRFSFHLY